MVIINYVLRFRRWLAPWTLSEHAIVINHRLEYECARRLNKLLLGRSFTYFLNLKKCKARNLLREHRLGKPLYNIKTSLQSKVDSRPERRNYMCVPEVERPGLNFEFGLFFLATFSPVNLI